MTELFPGNNLSAYFKSENILNWKDPQGWSSQAPDPAQDHPESHHELDSIAQAWEAIINKYYY